MATTVDSILVRIDADLGDLRKELARLDKTLNNTAKKTESSLKKVSNAFRTVLGAAVVYQTAQAGLALVNFVSGIEEMQAKSDVVFGQFVGTVRDELGAFAEEVGRSRYELEAMAASVQDTFVPLGFARGEAAQLSVQLAKLATDVASFNNASDTETMEAFQSAIVGNHETVRRFGIVITEATLTQELHRMGIKKTSQEATNAEKVQARLNLIINGTSDAHGDAARTADSFANRSKALGAALEELAVTTIGPFLNLLADFVESLTEAVRAVNGFFESLGQPARELPETLEEINAALADTEEELARLRAQAAVPFKVGPLGEDAAALARKTHEANMAILEQEIRSLQDQMILLEIAKQDLIDAVNKPDVTVDTPPEEPFQTFKQEDKALQAIQKLVDANRLLESELGGANEAQLEFLELMQKLENVTPEQAEAIKALTEANAQLKEELEATNPVMDSLVDGFTRASEQIADSIAEAMASGEVSLASFRDIAGDIVKQIISKFMQLAVINPIINSIFGAMGAPASAQLPTMSGPSAGGGSMHPSRPRIVGERGPELFVPHSAGTLMNGANTKSAMGGGAPVTVNQSLNFSVGVSDTVKAEIMNLMPVINQNAVSAVETARQRGGSLANAFGS